jgi:hypothetical protein
MRKRSQDKLAELASISSQYLAIEALNLPYFQGFSDILPENLKKL